MSVVESKAVWGDYVWLNKHNPALLGLYSPSFPFSGTYNTVTYSETFPTMCFTVDSNNVITAYRDQMSMWIALGIFPKKNILFVNMWTNTVVLCNADTALLIDDQAEIKPITWSKSSGTTMLGVNWNSFTIRWVK